MTTTGSSPGVGRSECDNFKVDSREKEKGRKYLDVRIEGFCSGKGEGLDSARKVRFKYL